MLPMHWVQKQGSTIRACRQLNTRNDVSVFRVFVGIFHAFYSRKRQTKRKEQVLITLRRVRMLSY